MRAFTLEQIANGLTVPNVGRCVAVSGQFRQIVQNRARRPLLSEEFAAHVVIDADYFPTVGTKNRYTFRADQST